MRRHGGARSVANVAEIVRSRTMQLAPDKMDVISAEAQTGLRGTGGSPPGTELGGELRRCRYGGKGEFQGKGEQRDAGKEERDADQSKN